MTFSKLRAPQLYAIGHVRALEGDPTSLQSRRNLGSLIHTAEMQYQRQLKTLQAVSLNIHQPTALSTAAMAVGYHRFTTTPPGRSSPGCNTVLLYYSQPS